MTKKCRLINYLYVLYVFKGQDSELTGLILGYIKWACKYTYIIFNLKLLQNAEYFSFKVKVAYLYFVRTLPSLNVPLEPITNFVTNLITTVTREDKYEPVSDGTVNFLHKLLEVELLHPTFLFLHVFVRIHYSADEAVTPILA